MNVLNDIDDTTTPVKIIAIGDIQSADVLINDEIQTGKRYNVTVTAVGNNQKARSSSESTAFKFIQISENVIKMHKKETKRITNFK